MRELGDLELSSDDLAGFCLEQVRCRQCGPFCAERQPLFYEGHPFALCSRRPEGRAVIERWKSHVCSQDEEA